MIERIRENIVGAFALLVVFSSLAAAGGVAYNIYSSPAPQNAQTATFSYEDPADNPVTYYPTVTSSAPLFIENPVTPSSLSVRINNGEKYVNSSKVTLHLSAVDAKICRYKNDEDTDWTSWEPYVTQKEWALSSGDGERIVAYSCKADRVSDDFGIATITVDSIKPVPVYEIEVENGYLTAKISVREILGKAVTCFAGVDGNETEFQVGINERNVGTSTYTAYIDGEEKIFTLRCYDEAGNMGQIPPKMVGMDNV
mgnify:FL=1